MNDFNRYYLFHFITPNLKQQKHFVHKTAMYNIYIL